MFKKILIANRGEIAIRIIRACQELNIETVAIYSEADRNSLHVSLADEAYCIGPQVSSASYLNIPNIISAALISRAEAIHPGYGFLAENTRFAEICNQHNIHFIGPAPQVLRIMGDKAGAREFLKDKIPIVPGSNQLDSLEKALKIAGEIGYPVLLKAALGGGGKGMRIISTPAELESLWSIIKAEAKVSFGDGRVYLEKHISNPRHIEVQVLGDKSGKIIHLGERECSIQRRNQKLIEESPAPKLDKRIKEQIYSAALACAKAIGYTSAGTVEFLLNDKGNFYFIEMNTRVQVEHPVTELVTNIDIVKEQIKIAAGLPIDINQKDIVLKGHAIECRINAEDYTNNFTPVTGKIESIHLPGGPGIRVDTHLYPGLFVSPYYDSLLAKLIAWGRDREEARVRMLRALQEFSINGISTIIPFHIKALKSEIFKEGLLNTNFINNLL